MKPNSKWEYLALNSFKILTSWMMLNSTGPHSWSQGWESPQAKAIITI